MRHRVKGKKFGRKRDPRRVMFRNLAQSLVEHERINTTLAKAKELRSLADRLVTYTKRGEVHGRRLAYKVLQNRTLVKKLFDEIGPRYTNISGGYTRVIKNGYRKGDKAQMAIIEYLEGDTNITDKDKIKSEDISK